MSSSTKLGVLPFAIVFVAGAAACSHPRDVSRDALAGAMCVPLAAEPEPDLVAWEPESRAQLDRIRRQGVVAVRYEARGCDVSLEILPHCIGPKNRYTYAPLVRAETKIVRDMGELLRTHPLGAANVSGLLRQGELRTELNLVGSVALPDGVSVSEYDFVGPECKRATHLVRAIYVGGFAMAAGRSTVPLFSAPPADGVAREGDPRICARAASEGIELPGCSVPLRVALVGLGGSGEEPRAPVVKHGRAATDAAPQRPFDQAGVERVVRDRHGSLKRRCWDGISESLRRVSVSVAINVDARGRVVRAEPTLVDATEGASETAATVARCIGAEIQSWQFPEPEHEEVITVPFHLFRQ